MRCFTVVGPSQTGKSTLVEKLAALGESSRKVMSPYGLNVTEFEIGKEAWCALDAPGATEAIAHAQHALLASDACVLCVSPAPEEAVLAAPYLKVIEASGTPCIIFVNRMDEPRGRLRDVIAALQDYSSHMLILRQVPIREGDRIVGSCDLISERAWRYREGQTSALIEIPEGALEREKEARAELLEHLSEFDDWLPRGADRGSRAGQRHNLCHFLAAAQGKPDHSRPCRRGEPQQRHPAPDEGAEA